MLDLDAKVAPTNFSVRFVAESIDGKDERWDRLRSTQQLKDVQLVPISGNGYLSSITRVRFIFDSDNESFSAILKVPSTATFDSISDGAKNGKDDVDADKRKDQHEEFVRFIGETHDIELDFYERVGRDAQQLHLPTVYAAKAVSDAGGDLSSACLLMEDLDVKGGLANVCKGLTKGQIESSIVAIADFHAYSLTLPKELMDRFKARPPKKEPDEQLPNMILGQLSSSGSEYLRKHDKSIRKFLAVTDSPFNFEGHTHFGTPPVLSHCDLWVNNIFFKKDADSNITDEVCVFLDWQCAHGDTGMSDLAHIIMIGASPAMQEQYFDEWLKLY
ncbi:calcium/calmodulin-dependent protein kinase type 1 [Aphelenchoides avenae]|nr:calcium/calmodulin-dependent protein kinase type 1 [Aphelenchus avenae]